MIRVNLLPTKYSKRQEQLRNQLTMVGVLALVLCGCMGGMQYMLGSELSDMKQSNAKLKKDIDSMKSSVSELEQADEIKADLQRKLGVIRNLKANRTGPVHMLDELAMATPEKIQLTALDQEKNTLQIAGVAVSNEVISQFLSNLEKSPYFDNVYLNAIDQTDTEGLKLKQFSITSKMVLAGGVEPEKEKDLTKIKKGK